jgi:Zn-dependent peptidase ImmA (M78 family)
VERTGIGESSLSEFENGKREPRLGQLQKLADLYQRPLSFLLGEGGIPVETVLWRERPNDETAGRVERELLSLAGQYHNLEAWCGETRRFELPRVSESSTAFSYADAARLAYRVHSELRLGDRPGRSLLTVLEEVCGIKVFHLRFEPTGAAACAVSDTFGAAILLNSGSVRRRRNFDLAHELFHLLTWTAFRASGQSRAIASPEEESLANCFASHLLMPSDVTRLAIRDAIGEGAAISYTKLFAVARQFDVSVEALLWRLRWLFGRSKEDTLTDIERCRGIGRMGENRELDEPPTRPTRYIALAISAIRAGEMSLGRFAKYLGISRGEAMRLAEREAFDDGEIAIPPA